MPGLCDFESFPAAVAALPSVEGFGPSVVVVEVGIGKMKSGDSSFGYNMLALAQTSEQTNKGPNNCGPYPSTTRYCLVIYAYRLIDTCPYYTCRKCSAHGGITITIGILIITLDPFLIPGMVVHANSHHTPTHPHTTQRHMTFRS